MALCLFASEVASLTGNHRYQPVEETLIKVWKRNDPDHYRAALVAHQADDADEVVDRLLTHVDLTQVTEAPQKKVSEIHKALKGTVPAEKLDEAVQVAVRKRALVEQEPEEQLKKKVKQEAERSGLSKKAIAKALQQVQSRINCGKGSHQEQAGLDAYEQQHNKVVRQRNAQLYRFYGKEYVVVGKVDGMEADGTLVEHKHRMKRLFTSTPRYERVQIMVYMKLLGVMRARLVQHYRGETKSTTIAWDGDLWKELQSGLESIATRYQTLLVDREYQKRILSS